MTSTGKRKVSITPDVSVSLLSIPALVNKNIYVVFMPEKEILVELENHFAVFELQNKMTAM